MFLICSLGVRAVKVYAVSYPRPAGVLAGTDLVLREKCRSEGGRARLVPLKSESRPERGLEAALEVTLWPNQPHIVRDVPQD